MVESLGQAARELSYDQQSSTLLETGGPVQSIRLTLENGVHLSYPGMRGPPKDFDGRTDPLYQRAKHSEGVVWAPPGASGDGILLEAATNVRDPNGELIGVVRFQLNLRFAVDAALDASEVPQVESSLLVERTGRVLAQRSNPGGSAEPEILAMDDVRNAIQRGEAGYVETAREGRPVLVTYQPLSTVDWYLVTIANVGKLEAKRLTSAARDGSIARAAETATASATATAVPPRRPLPKPAPVEPIASAEPSASASVSVKALTGKLPIPTAPPNPFDPWKAYQKEKPK
ncbi:MAG: cache domain-containing protein [Myxococcales bacterium]|nr:cache domain-containing protein [Myxococcales bacterium]